MRIGIVNMHKDAIDIQRLIQAVTAMGYSPYILNGTTANQQVLFHRIQKSPIRHWIFSGSRYAVLHMEHQVPMALLETDKKFMMICYSMQSILVQLDVPIKRRYIRRTEPFHLTVPREHKDHPLFKGIPSPMNVWRDHQWYFSKADIPSPVKLLASYNGEVMIATYKNAVLVQHHPERTADGKRFLENWLAS
jgi:GMP synthase-like glutamine amidotransferase